MWCNILRKGKMIFHITVQTDVPCQYWAVICFWHIFSSSRHLQICFFRYENGRQCWNIWSKFWIECLVLSVVQLHPSAFVILWCSISFMKPLCNILNLFFFSDAQSVHYTKQVNHKVFQGEKWHNLAEQVIPLWSFLPVLVRIEHTFTAPWNKRKVSQRLLCKSAPSTTQFGLCFE